MRKQSVTLLALLFFMGGHAQTKKFIDQPFIEVSGNVDTLVTPNEIFIKIVLSEKDTKDRTSVEEQETKMVNALKALGIDTEKDLTVNDMASNFRSYLLKSKDVLKTKQYMLKVTDAVMASKVFMQLEDVSISNTTIDQVNHSNLENIRNVMRGKAIENAKARAVALTKPLDQILGSAINIIDNDDNRFDGMLQGKVAGVVIRGVSSLNSNTQQELPKIEFQKIKVSANVNVTFILKQS